MAYDSKAQEFAYSFYARGLSREKAVREIRKVYAGFSGSTWDEWESKLGWKQRRALADAKLREFEDSCRDLNKTLLLELGEIRAGLYKTIVDGKADAQTYYAYLRLAKQTHEISAAHFAGRDNDRVAVKVLDDAVQLLLLELRGIPGLMRPLEENAAAVGAAVAEVVEKFGQE
ncbi:MAG TPA: hypothetical protein VHC90_11445 [Bryobacteraceae bacterium]|nr:hypothetical protein [Bryobacteraceae bacterium]